MTYITQIGKFLFLASILLLTACSEEDDAMDMDDADVQIKVTGLDADLSGPATYEVESSSTVPYLAVTIGENPKLIMQFPLSEGESMIETGSYQMTATLSNDPSNVYTQFSSGFDIYYPEEGAIEIINAAGGSISGSLSGVLQTNEGESVEVGGIFTAQEQ